MHRIDLRFPEGRAKCLTLSYDDGVAQDLRLCALMKQYGIAGTFNISSGLYAPEGTVFDDERPRGRMTLEKCREVYLSSPLFEVATHGLHHTHCATLPTSEAVYEILTDRRNLEAQFGILCRGHAYPYGSRSPELAQTLACCGIAYARIIRPTYQFTTPMEQGFWEFHPTCHHKDPRLPELTEKFLTEEVRNGPYLFYVWGHSYEFDRDNNWNVIAEFFEKVSGKPDVWYATNIQIYDYVQSYRSLIWSADGGTVYNPTATDIWLSLNSGDATARIPSGQRITL